MKKQDQEQQERKVIIAIDSFFSYERNIAIFVNYTSTLFFNFYNSNKSNQKMPFGETIFYKVFFLFQKYQILIFQKVIDIMDGKKDHIFDKNQWKVYLKSPEFNNTQQAIKNDKEFMMPYFKEVLKRTLKLCSKVNVKDEAEKQKLKNFEQLVNDSFVENQLFKQVFNECLLEFIQKSNETISTWKSGGTSERDFLLTARFAIFCLNPYNKFTWESSTQTTDFHKFYENYENMEEAAIQQEFLNDVKKVLK